MARTKQTMQKSYTVPILEVMPDAPWENVEIPPLHPTVGGKLIAKMREQEKDRSRKRRHIIRSDSSDEQEEEEREEPATPAPEVAKSSKQQKKRKKYYKPRQSQATQRAPTRQRAGMAALYEVQHY